MATNEAGLVQLDSWLWESDGWQAGENAAFEFLSAGDGPVLGTAIGDNGTFLLVFVAMDRAEALQTWIAASFTQYVPLMCLRPNHLLQPILKSQRRWQYRRLMNRFHISKSSQRLFPPLILPFWKVNLQAVLSLARLTRLHLRAVSSPVCCLRDSS
jgi:hypothetical protein